MSGMFDYIEKYMQRFEDQGYAQFRVRSRKRYKGMKYGDYFKVKNVFNKKNGWMITFEGVRGMFKAREFKPATKNEFEKYQLMEELG